LFLAARQLLLLLLLMMIMMSKMMVLQKLLKMYAFYCCINPASILAANCTKLPQL